MKVKETVIQAIWLGTRFQLVTKAQSKEIFSNVDKPSTEDNPLNIAIIGKYKIKLNSVYLLYLI